MKNVAEHIRVFDERMRQKGYDQAFISQDGYPGKLPECLTDYFHAGGSDGEKMPALPVKLTTYTDWQEEGKPYSTAYFSVDFTADRGFSVVYMAIERHGGSGNRLQRKELTIGSPEKLPTRQQVNALVNPEGSRFVRSRNRRMRF